MSQIFFIKVGATLVPSAAEDAEKMKSWKQGDVIAGEFRKPRNGKFHRKCRKLLSIMFENQMMFENMKHFEPWIKIKAGWFEEVTTPDGLMFIPKSTAYDAMDEVDHADYYNALVNLAVSDDSLLGHMTDVGLRRHIDQLTGFL